MNWGDYIKIAKALDRQYPDDCPFSMSESELIEKVVVLPDFEGEKEPPDAFCVHRILIEWKMNRGDEIYVEPYVDSPDDW